MSSSDEHIVFNGDLVSGKRYEIKIPFPSRQTPEVMVWVHLHPEQWRVAFPPRQVNNIYFDTYNFTNLKDNIDGVSDRKKLRVRWYGDQFEIVTGSQLEVKHKKGFIGWKNIYPIPGVLQLTHCSWHQIISHLKSSIPSASLWLQRYPNPTIINSYHRQYYTSSDAELRLTIDTHLRSFTQQASSLPNIERSTLSQPYTIVEIKTDPANVERLTEVLSHTISRVSRFSKYVSAVLATVE